MTKHTKTVEEIIERIREVGNCTKEPEGLDVLRVVPRMAMIQGTSDGGKNGWRWLVMVMLTEGGTSIEYDMLKTLRQNLEDSEDLRELLTDTLF